MPYFNGVNGRVQFRSWLVPNPQAGVVFLHGPGLQADLDEGLAPALNRRAIDLWVVGHAGREPSGSERGTAGSLGALEADGRRLTELARDARPGVPVFLAGDALGGADRVAHWVASRLASPVPAGAPA